LYQLKENTMAKTKTIEVTEEEIKMLVEIRTFIGTKGEEGVDNEKYEMINTLINKYYFQ
jgi:hypothetical protein